MCHQRDVLFAYIDAKTWRLLFHQKDFVIKHVEFPSVYVVLLYAGGFGGISANTPGRMASLKRPEDLSADNASIPQRQQSPFRSLSP